MYQALYRAYRPETFQEVLGQEHIVRILKNQIETDSTSHAYLFCGTRGTGKTTTARLLAKGLNCLSDEGRPCGTCANCRAIRDGSFMDVIEIDAASNNGVDNIRELRESVNYPPATGRKKVYIIDEVHMLSAGAFNALLKTLEEPPEYVTFILATTEVHKLPATILSRCMRLDFKRVPENTLISGMAGICGKIGIEVTEDALRIIAANADGSVRDGLSILDQCISGGEKSIDSRNVLEFLGASGDEDFLELTELVRKRKTSDAIVFLAGVLSDGKDVRQFMKDWINHFRNLLMVKFMRDPGAVVNMSEENIERIRRQGNVMELEDINRGIIELSRTLNEARWSTQPRILLELSIVKMCLGGGQIRELSEQEFPQAASAEEPAVHIVEDHTAQKPEEPVTRKPEEPAAPKPEEPVTRKPEEPAAPKPEPDRISKPAVTQEEIGDPEEIWERVFRDGLQIAGSFSIVGSGSTLTEIDDKDFTLSVTADVVKDYAERNRKLIEDLMEKHTGRRRVMRIAGSKRSEPAVEEVAENISNVIGIHVDIE